MIVTIVPIVSIVAIVSIVSIVTIVLGMAMGTIAPVGLGKTFGESFLSLFAEGGWELFADDQSCDDARDGTEADKGEEVGVSQPVAHVAGYHAWQAHAGSHQSGGQGIVCSLVGALGKVDEVKHVGCKSNAVSKLFDGNEDAHYP